MADETPESTPAPAAPKPEVSSADQPIPPETLKSAFNAFKKRWKIMKLDQESRIGRGPMSSGQRSAIAGIQPPDQFPRAVWDELARQGRIKRQGGGFYGMP